jgi:AcrR family transcriptional regulator
VARRAGVAKGTIYLYFADKEALFMAAARSRVRPVLDEMAGFADGYSGTTRELLGLMFEAIHRQLVESDLKVLIRIIVAEGERFPALTGHYYEEIIAKGRELLGYVISRGIERGEVRPGAAADLPVVLIAPAIMAAIWRLSFERHAPIPPQAFLSAHCDLVFNGLLVPEPARRVVTDGVRDDLTDPRPPRAGVSRTVCGAPPLCASRVDPRQQRRAHDLPAERHWERRFARH